MSTTSVIVTIVVAIISSGVLNTFMTHWFNAKEKKTENCDAINKSLRLLLKDRLRYLCEHYIEQGWIYADELEDIIAMHSVYHNDLKGNGYLDALMSKVKALEIRGIGVK